MSPKPSTIRVLLVAVNAPPVAVNVEKSLPALQALIGGGYLEPVTLAPRVMLLCDEEGLHKQLPMNRSVSTQYFDGDIVGDFFITRVNDAGEHVDLTDADVALWSEVFKLKEK